MFRESKREKHEGKGATIDLFALCFVQVRHILNLLLHGYLVHTIFIHEAGTFHERSREALRGTRVIICIYKS